MWELDNSPAIVLFETMVCLNVTWRHFTIDLFESGKRFIFQFIIPNTVKNTDHFKTLSLGILGVSPALSFHTNQSFWWELANLIHLTYICWYFQKRFSWISFVVEKVWFVEAFVFFGFVFRLYQIIILGYLADLNHLTLIKNRVENTWKY